MRGIFAVSAAAYLDLTRPPDLLSDERGDIVYYSLRRTIELLSQANPNILELLFMPVGPLHILTPDTQQTPRLLGTPWGRRPQGRSH